MKAAKSNMPKRGVFMLKSLCLAFFSLPFFVFADSFYIKENVEPYSDADTLNQLVKNELVSLGHSVMLSPEESRWVLTPKLLRLGRSYVVTLSKERKGRIVFSQKLKSETLDDLDIVTERLVRAVLKRQNVSSTQNVDTITQNEIKGTSVKTEVTKQFYFGFGPGVLSGLESDETGSNWTAGYLWGIDHQFGLRLGLEHTSGEGNSNFWNLGMGGQYYLNRRKHAPYLLGLFGYSWAESNADKTENGFSIEAGLGSHFFRTAKVNLAIEVVYAQGLYDVLESSPGVFAGRLIVLW